MSRGTGCKVIEVMNDLCCSWPGWSQSPCPLCHWEASVIIVTSCRSGLGKKNLILKVSKTLKLFAINCDDVNSNCQRKCCIYYFENFQTCRKCKILSKTKYTLLRDPPVVNTFPHLRAPHSPSHFKVSFRYGNSSLNSWVWIS